MTRRTDAARLRACTDFGTLRYPAEETHSDFPADTAPATSKYGTQGALRIFGLRHRAVDPDFDAATLWQEQPP